MVVIHTLVTGSTHKILSNYWDASAGAYDGWVDVVTDLYGSAATYRVAYVQTDDGTMHIIYADHDLSAPNYGLSHVMGSTAQPVVWTKGTQDITGSDEALYPAVATDGTNLWVFYVAYDGGTTSWTDVIKYVKWTPAGGWESPVELHDASAENLPTRAIGCWERAGGGKIGVIYSAGSGSPYDTKYEELTLPVTSKPWWLYQHTSLGVQ
jgi:hypothetical protein